MGRRNVRPADLVSVQEIAERAGVQPDTVHKWRARHPDFPKPFSEVAGSIPVWIWQDVKAWLEIPRPPGPKARSRS